MKIIKNNNYIENLQKKLLDSLDIRIISASYFYSLFEKTKLDGKIYYRFDFLLDDKSGRGDYEIDIDGFIQQMIENSENIIKDEKIKRYIKIYLSEKIAKMIKQIGAERLVYHAEYDLYNDTISWNIF